MTLEDTINHAVVMSAQDCWAAAFVRSQKYCPVRTGKLKREGRLIHRDDGSDINYPTEYAPKVEFGEAAKYERVKKPGSTALGREQYRRSYRREPWYATKAGHTQPYEGMNRFDRQDAYYWRHVPARPGRHFITRAVNESIQELPQFLQRQLNRSFPGGRYDRPS